MDELLKYFHFLRPYWLLLIPLALLIYWRFKKNQSTEEKYKKLIAPHLLKHLIVGEKDKWKLEPMHMILTVLIIGTIAFAGPTWKRELPPFTEDKAPLTVVLSLSESMDAIDVSPTRLERAKQKIVELLKLRPGARSSLFVYAKESFMVLPLTTDTRLIELYLNSLSTSLMPVDGSNTEAALNKVEEFLKEEEVPGTILLITDSIEKEIFNKFNEIKDSTNNQIIVLGTGTSKGGPIKVGKNRFKTNQSGQRITPKLDINNFKELRDNYNIPVTTLSIENDDVEWIQKRVQTHLQEVQQSNTDTRWIEYGYYLLFPIVILMLLWFRKGWSVRWIVMLIIYISFFNTSSYAYENEVVSDSIKSSVDSTDITDVNKYKWEWFFNLWMTRDQQGRYYFERNDFPKAAERFENNLWKGISLYYAKNYDDAINQFAMLEDAQSHFYLGNSYARLENYELAKTSYEEAIRLEKEFPEAEYNLKIVLAILKKIEEEKKKDEEEEAQDPNQSPDEIKFDEKGKKGKKGKVEELKLTPEKMADIWMRNIQVSPADFLRRKFHIQSEKK